MPEEFASVTQNLLDHLQQAQFNLDTAIDNLLASPARDITIAAERVQLARTAMRQAILDVVAAVSQQ